MASSAALCFCCFYICTSYAIVLSKSSTYHPQIRNTTRVASKLLRFSLKTKTFFTKIIYSQNGLFLANQYTWRCWFQLRKQNTCWLLLRKILEHARLSTIVHKFRTAVILIKQQSINKLIFIDKIPIRVKLDSLYNAGQANKDSKGIGN